MRKNSIPLTAAAINTIIFMAIYVVGQQTIRLSANLPQIEKAQDIASWLDEGVAPAEVLATESKVNIATSSARFVIVYDKQGQVVAGTGTLDGKVPVVPYGVLQSTPSKGYHAVTWQPQSNVRLASVEVQSKHYYVLAARSLADPEKLITTIGKLTAVGYITTMLVLLGGYWLYTKPQPAANGSSKR